MTRMVMGNISWNFPADHDLFAVHYEDLSNILPTGMFEVFVDATNGSEVLEIVASGGIVKAN